MEILFYYFVACISFSLMYYVNYGVEIIQTVKDVLPLFDIDYKEEGDWHPVSYSLAVLAAATLAMPMFLFIIVTTDKYELIKETTSEILIRYYGFERQD